MNTKISAAFQPGNKFKFPEDENVYIFVLIDYQAIIPTVYYQEDEGGELKWRSGFHLSDLIHA